MLIKTLPVGHLETNCYVVTDEDTLNCAVIDPGEESNTILDYIESNHLKCKVIMITHGHFDHVGAVNAVAEETGAKVYMNKKDDARYDESGYMRFQLPEGGAYYDQGDVVELDSLRFEIFATPGHTRGGVSIRCQNALFTGDTLFKGSCGRTDFPGGDMDEELRSLKKLCQLKGDYEVYPGHMDPSTLERERQFNYYCRVAMDK